MMADTALPNVFVFVLDTIRVDRVKGLGAPGDPESFLERVIHRGSLLSNFIVSGNSTRISVNALFNGFYGGTSGLNYHYDCDDDFRRSRVLTLADLFAHHGYRTLGVSQGDVYLPLWNFERFETFQQRFELDDLAAELHASGRPLFAYLHFSNLHDLAFGAPERMTPEVYDEHLAELSAELEAVWQRLVTDEDVVVLVSDHGCNLRAAYDPDWRFYLEDEPTGGIFLGDQTIRGLCSIIAPGRFPVRRLHGITRSIDLFPTLLDALGLKRPRVQGRSLWPVLLGDEPMPPLLAFAEAGGIRLADGSAICRTLRGDRFKYNRYEIYGEQLFDRDADPQESDNLIASGHPMVETMRSACAEQVEANRRGIAPFYDLTPELVERILTERPPLPRVERGSRGSCFSGLIDPQVHAYLRQHIAAQLPRWREQGERILVYSASEHARAFLDAIPPGDRTLIVGVVDGNPKLAGQQWCGVPVFGPEEFETNVAASLLVVAHHFFAHDMYARIKEVCRRPVPVVNLYHLEREIPLWWDRHD